MKCKVCEYEWQPRIKTPKACPRCKRYMALSKIRTTIDMKKCEVCGTTTFLDTHHIGTCKKKNSKDGGKQ